MYYVYVLESISTNRLYIGQTSNLSKRLAQHNTGKSPYTKTRGPWKLIGSITCNSRSEAVQLESRLKKWKRKDRVLAYLKKHSHS